MLILSFAKKYQEFENLVVKSLNKTKKGKNFFLSKFVPNSNFAVITYRTMSCICFIIPMKTPKDILSSQPFSPI